MTSTLPRRITSVVLAALMAFSAMAFAAQPADAHRYRGHGGALAFGVAAAVIAGIALSRHHRHRHHYYGYYGYDDYPYYSYRRHYYAPRYRSYGYYGGGHHYRGYSHHVNRNGFAIHGY